MPIELNKILRHIADESVLKPSLQNAKKNEIEDAWTRVSKKSNLSVHETKSIFKVLQKKYEQERVKETSSWKLFDVMNEIHSTPEEEDEDSEASMEENEEYEMLEVDEEQQQQQQDFKRDEHEELENSKKDISASLKKPSSEMTSDGESPTKSSHENSPERINEKQTDAKRPTFTQAALREEKKLLNSLLSPNSNMPAARQSKQMTPTTAAMALQQKRGITLKKANTTATPQASQTLLRSSQTTDMGRTIQLPESIKRKLNEDTTVATSQTKKMLLGQPTGNIQKISPISNKTQQQAPKSLTQSKISSTCSILKRKDSDENSSHNAATFTATPSTKSTDSTNVTTQAPTVTTHHGLKVITFPVESKNELNADNSAAGLSVITLPFEENRSLLQNGGTKTLVKANGIRSSSQMEELDFSDHILISSNAAAVTTGNEENNTKTEIRNGAAKDDNLVNLGNFSDELPRAFFNNLCNSKRYESFCLYVANVMNRLEAPVAARLELKIMRAVLDAQSEAMKES